MIDSLRSLDGIVMGAVLAALIVLLAVVFQRLQAKSQLLDKFQAREADSHDHSGGPGHTQVGGKYRNKEEFRQDIQRLGAAIWDWNISPSRLNITDEFIEFTGYTLDDLGAHPRAHLNMIHPAERDKARENFNAYLDGDRPDCEFEFRFLFPDGEYRWVKSRVVAFWDEDGKPARVVGSLMDISERVSAEEERDRLFNLSLDMLAVGGYDGFLQQLNPAWVRVLGWSRDDLMAEPILVFIHVEDQDLFGEALRQLEEGQLVEDLQCRFRCRDNTYKWLSWSSFPYPEHRKVFSVVRDITSQMEAQFKIRESQERLRSLSNQLSLVEDRQRRQLAEAIHDGLAQQLFGVRALVTLLRYPDKLDDMQQVVTDILAVLDETMDEARSLSFELFPAELQEVGLQAALGWMANEFQERNEMRCEVVVENEGPELSEDLRAMAYQCVRELFNNVKKHAAASEIKISLNHVDRYLTIVVGDNGCGFEITESGSQESRKLEHEGFGLFSIRERVRSVGGRMLVDSRLGKGCRVFLSFPLDQSPS
jgi:PAS domain S-box-containing protein